MTRHHFSNKEEKYKFIYKCTLEFITETISNHSKLNESILNQHLEDKSKFDTLEDANERMVRSLANRNMMSSVINLDKNGKELRDILCGYAPLEIINTYLNSEGLFKVFKNKFEIRNAQSKRNLWRKFAEGIISGSKFMVSFKNKDDFDAFVKMFAFNKYTRAALPMLLSTEIEGFGFALACDFLKELGYRDYPKPDVYLIRIFKALEISASTNPYEVYKSIIEMSEAVGDDAYTVDKIFWLIGSGNFYKVKVKIGRSGEKFIRFVKNRIQALSTLEAIPSFS